MSDRTYQPTGTGLCKTCGHDVGEHDAGHEYSRDRFSYTIGCAKCGTGEYSPIHDVGRVLRCPKEPGK